MAGSVGRGPARVNTFFEVLRLNKEVKAHQRLTTLYVRISSNSSSSSSPSSGPRGARACMRDSIRHGQPVSGRFVQVRRVSGTAIHRQAIDRQTVAGDVVVSDESIQRRRDRRSTAGKQAQTEGKSLGKGCSFSHSTILGDSSGSRCTRCPDGIDGSDQTMVRAVLYS